MNKVVLSGSLNFLGLGDLLQLIGSNGSSGILSIISKYSSEPGLIYFDKGNIINGSSPSQKGLEAVYSLFGWTEGTFEFTEAEVKIKKVITESRMGIILDGLRMVDDGQTKKLGPVSYDKTSDTASSIPVIKGPIVDYMYVLDEEKFGAGHKIVQENKHGSWMWVILEGVADVLKKTPKGPLNIMKLGSGSFIGGVTSFSYQGNIRTATVQAVGEVQLGVMDSQRLAEEYGNLSREFRNFSMSLDKRLNEITERAVDAYMGRDILKKFTADKNKLKKQDIKQDALFMINQGEVCIVLKTKTGYLPLANLGEMDFIGVTPFIDIGHEPRNTTIFVSEDFELEEVDAEKLKDEYERLSPTLKSLIDSYATNISVTTRIACDFQNKKK